MDRDHVRGPHLDRARRLVRGNASTGPVLRPLLPRGPGRGGRRLAPAGRRPIPGSILDAVFQPLLDGFSHTPRPRSAPRGARRWVRHDGPRRSALNEACPQGFEGGSLHETRLNVSTSDSERSICDTDNHFGPLGAFRDRECPLRDIQRICGFIDLSGADNVRLARKGLLDSGRITNVERPSLPANGRRTRLNGPANLLSSSGSAGCAATSTTGTMRSPARSRGSRGWAPAPGSTTAKTSRGARTRSTTRAAWWRTTPATWRGRLRRRLITAPAGGSWLAGGTLRDDGFSNDGVARRTPSARRSPARTGGRTTA